MLAFFVALLASVLPALVTSQSQQYTVWSSVIYSRIGERTPEVLGDLPTTLTSLGAQQSYQSGTLFRQRYVSSDGGSASGLTSAPIQGLSANSIDSLQLYVEALDEQACIASAQAFLQGFYPPFTLNTSIAPTLDPTSMLSNGTYVDYPLSGYQYAQIHAAGALDPDFPYIGGSLDCPAFDLAAEDYTNTPEFAATEAASKSTYSAVGPPLLADVLVPGAWDYYNAYAIYDYLNYQNAHNTTVAALLAQPQYISPESNISYLDALRWFADQQQYAQLGNLSAQNNYSGTVTSMPGGISGSISTIAGNLLAAKVLAQLQYAIQEGGDLWKLNVLFGDFEPLMSFFALAGLPSLDSNFYGLADFGSVAVFELFSYTNSSMDMSFPSTDDLWVQFLFRNGTNGNDGGGDLQAYPLFGRGPSQTQMSWNDFQSDMYGILLGDIGDWCTQCGAVNIFCAAWNSSDTANGSSGSSTNNSLYHHGQWKKHLAVAGVIGAVIGLVLVAIVFGLIMAIGRVRFHRIERSHKKDLGGFKGGQKMASDRDLTIPKGGAVVGASVERSPESPISPIGHERVGSWELKEAEAGRPNIADGIKRPSFEDEEPVDPFVDAVRADERV